MPFNKLIDLVKELNEAIADDESLGEGFQIGHSYFSNIQLDEIAFDFFGVRSRAEANYAF